MKEKNVSKDTDLINEGIFTIKKKKAWEKRNNINNLYQLSHTIMILSNFHSDNNNDTPYL